MATVAKKLVTPVGRVSFPKVYKPEAFNDGEPKYGVTLIFPKGTDLSELKAAAAAKAREFWGDKLPQIRSPFRDGAERPGVDGYKPGDIFVAFTNKLKPGVYDVNKDEIPEDSGRFYAGCNGRVSCVAVAYDQKGNRGIKFSLCNVQKVGDGEPFGMSRGDAEDFDEITTDIDDVDHIPF